MDNIPASTHSFRHPNLSKLGVMEGTLQEDAWDGTLFMPHPRHHEAMNKLGLEPEAGLFLDGAEVKPLT